jgi:hypothetical protein
MSTKRVALKGWYLICVPTTGGLPWVAESVEGAIDLSDDVRCASRDVLVGHVVCTERRVQELKGRKKQITHTFEAGQEVHRPIVIPRQTIRRGRDLEIRHVCQLIVPPRRVNRGVRSEALVECIVQVLQGRSDDPRSTGRTGGDLELSRFEVLSDGRGNRRLWSLSGVDVVGGRGREPESVRGSGSYEGDEGEKSTKEGERSLYAQLEKSSISLFKMIPSGVMTVEPQYRLIAICELINIRHGSFANTGKMTYSW